MSSLQCHHFIFVVSVMLTVSPGLCAVSDGKRSVNEACVQGGVSVCSVVFRGLMVET